MIYNIYREVTGQNADTAVLEALRPIPDNQLSGYIGSGAFQTALSSAKSKVAAEQAKQQQEAKQKAFAAEQAAKQGAFINKLTTGLTSAQEAASAELGLPGLRESAFGAGQQARGIQAAAEAIPGTQQTIAKQVGISAPRLQQRVGREYERLQPAISSAGRTLEEANRALQYGTEEYGRRLEQFLTPLQIEAGFLGDQVKNEFDLFKNQINNDLTMAIARLQEKGLGDRAALEQAQRLAEIEKAATSGAFTDLGDKVALINPQTGEMIQSFLKGLAPTRGTAGSSGW
jgi:hypothetical protein